MKKFTNIKKVAIISDTHNYVACILNLIHYIHTHDIDLVIHAGDFTSPNAASQFKTLKLPFIAVTGNMDKNPKKIKQELKNIGIVESAPFCFFINDKKVFLTHDLSKDQNQAEQEQPDIIIHGHTHMADISTDPILIINPGEACGMYWDKNTIAVLNMETMKAEILDLGDVV